MLRISILILVALFLAMLVMRLSPRLRAENGGHHAKPLCPADSRRRCASCHPAADIPSLGASSADV